MLLLAIKAVYTNYEYPFIIRLITMSDNTSNGIFARYALLDALHHEAPATGLKSTKRLFLRSLYHSVLFKAIFIVAACVLLIVLPFIEHKSSFAASTNYLTFKEDSVSTQSMLFWIGMIIELIFLGVLTVDVVLRGIILFPLCEIRRRPSNCERCKLSSYEMICKRYTFTFCVYAASLAISWLFLFGGFLTLIEPISFLKDEFTFIRQLVRPMFLIVQVSMIRKGLEAIFYSSLQLISILLLLFIVVFVFMMLGFAIFPHHLHSEHFGQSNIVADTDTVEEGEMYFNSSADTFWYLLVYLSTANSPDFGTPAYNNHRAYFFFFAIFFFLSSYLILKVISAFYALRFLHFLKESLERTNNNRQQCFEEAFKYLKDDSNTVKVHEIQNITVTELNIVDYNTFQILCVQKRNLNNREFKDLLSNLFGCCMPLEEDKNFYFGIGSSNTNTSKKTYYLYRAYFVFNILSLPCAMISFIILTTVFMVEYDDSLTEPHSLLVILLLTYSCLLIIEVFVRIGIFVYFLIGKNLQQPSCNFKNYGICIKRFCCILLKWFCLGHNLRSDAATKRFLGFLVDFFDWLLLFSIIVLGFIHIPCLNEGTYDDCFGLRNHIRVIQVTIVLIIFRMFRMLAKIPTFAIIFKSLLHILILLVPLMLLGYLFYYEFAVIGMAIFRGVNLNDTMAAIDCGSYENLNYHPYNFEDFGSSLVVLWNLMIVNNWHIIVDAYVRRMSPYVRIYFVIWWLFTEAILNGVLFGFLLEILSQAMTGYFELIKKMKKSDTIIKKIYFILKHYVLWWKTNPAFYFNMPWSMYDVIEEHGEVKQSSPV